MIETQTALFHDPIGRFEALLGRLQDCHPIRMETRSERRDLRKEVESKVNSGKGIYVFYEDEKPLYVGRTDQMADRVLNHGNKPSSNSQSAATFALILAKYKFKKDYNVPHGLFSKKLARKLNACPNKMDLWLGAVDRVKRMTVRVVEVEHPHEQAVFEVYFHEKLETPFNSFINH